jgi:hypothetical protein
MKFFGIAFVAALLALSITSCSTFKASGLAVNAKGAQYTSLGEFQTEVWVNSFLGASAGSKLFNLTADATEGPIADAIQKEISAKGGTAAVNITIQHKASFVNLLLNWITGDIYAPGTVIISGTVIK